MHILRAENLAKSYRGHPVVRDVTLSIRSGQVVGLLAQTARGKPPAFT
jgi:lipopolysaccharide export system ATP-binding protein